MIEVEASRIIERPIEAVWAYVSNLDNMVAWDPGLVDVKWHPQLAPGDAVELHDASLLLRLVERIGGRFKSTFHVTDYEEGRQFGLRVSPSPKSWLQATYRLDPESPGATKVTRVGSLNGEGGWRLVEVLLSGRLDREREAEVINLKRILESTTA